MVASSPQNLESISLNEDEREFAVRKIRELDEVKPKVDYSDFANFVFFNSAFDYFTLTAEKIVNEYPHDGSRELLQAFLDDLDDYQNYIVSQFPKTTSHLRFNPSISSSYISVNDYGYDPKNNRAQTAILSPGTGSISIEFWCQPPPELTGSNDVMVVLQKISGSNGDGYTVYFSGSKIHFSMVSGSVTDQVSADSTSGQTSYVACVFDKDSELISILTGSAQEFPVVASSASSNIVDDINLGTTTLYLGSGSLSGKVVRPLTGALDNVLIWNYPRTLQEASGTFNIRQYAQYGLVGHWNFNETGSISNIHTNSENTIVKDRSGHRLDGIINRYFYGIRSSGSLLPYDKEDLVLNLNVPVLQEYIIEQQTSGSDYDRINDNLITRMLPSQFFQLEEFKGTDVLEKFLYVLARNFDYLKIRIDQFVNVLRQNYGEYDQTPDVLLADIGKFFGWEFTGNFLSSDVSQYIIGRNVLHNTEKNREIDKKLYIIKNEFWKRTLLNLMHLYKTKGTRESIESLFRIYGVNRNFVRLKEFGLRPSVGITTERIYSEKSIPALAFGSGSATGSAYVLSPQFSSSIGSVEVRVRFPTTSSSGITATIASGSIWRLKTVTGSTGFPYSFGFSFGNQISKDLYHLYYQKAAVDAITGSLLLSSSEGNFNLTGAQIFDNKWYNIVFTRNESSGTLSLNVTSVDGDELDLNTSASITASLGITTNVYDLWIGATASLYAQYWMQEARVWDERLEQEQILDHALNYQSYGTRDIQGERDLLLHYRLWENVTASSGGQISRVIDVSTNNRHGTGYGFMASENPYKKFLNEYNFIASPDMGWTENLVRIIPDTKVKVQDAFTSNRVLALEFNMIDALNEDISQIISTIEEFNYAIGLPVNRYRDSYKNLEVLRTGYFKRLQDRLNFRIFADMLEFFDRSFIDMVRRLIPARSTFLGDQFVVESHMLERPKHQWEYRRQKAPLVLEGVIKAYERT